MDTIFTLVLGLLLRIGVPLAVTILVFFLLRRLDEAWQKEARALPVVSSQRPCWEVKGCSEENRKNCPAPAHPKAPCWQVYRLKTGQLREECLGCEVFRLAPIPTVS
jgi:hypothetical protein